MLKHLLQESTSKVGIEYHKTTTILEDDFTASLNTMADSFLTWHRLQKNNIVKNIILKYVESTIDWKSRYPLKFKKLHKGELCSRSIEIGKGKYSKVYKKGSFAYKYIKIHGKNKFARRSNLKCNLKELIYFNSITHPNIMKPSRSQIIMQHGSITRIIHEMKAAKHTLHEVVLSHDITSFSDILTYATGIAKGLQYLHTNNIIHGDITLGNILIMEDGEPMISDFTLTTFQNKGKEVAFGSLNWRSPECIVQHECTTKSDVWSFGVILLDCLYGCVYFQDVLCAISDKDLFQKLIELIGQPSFAWVQKYMQNKTDWTFCKQPELKHHMESAPFLVDGNELVKQKLIDIISKIIVWDPQKRFNMDQVLSHEFFSDYIQLEKQTLKGVQDLKTTRKSSSFQTRFKSTLLGEKNSKSRDWKICWRNKAEKTYLQNLLIHWTQNNNITQIHDWLLDDMVIVSKKIIDNLRYTNVLFQHESIVNWVANFYYFIWYDKWNNHPFFECAMYHILYLIDMVGFPLHITESPL
jgi:serine/threonine protein kinase